MIPIKDNPEQVDILLKSMKQSIKNYIWKICEFKMIVKM